MRWPKWMSWRWWWTTPEPELEIHPDWLKLVEEIQSATETGSYMILVLSMNGVQVRVFRRTQAFPVDRFEDALETIEKDLSDERDRVEQVSAPATVVPAPPSDPPE